MVKRRHCHTKPIATRAQHCTGRHINILQPDMGVIRCPMPQFPTGHSLSVKTRRASRHQPSANTVVAQRTINAGKNNCHMRNTAIGDPNLLTIEAKAFAISNRNSFHASGIAARIRLRQAIATNELGRYKLRQILQPLRRTSPTLNALRHKTGVHGHETTHRRIRPPQLLVTKRQAYLVPGPTAVFCRQRSPQQPQLGHFSHKGHGHFAALVHLARQRRHALKSKLARSLLHVFLRSAKRKIHE